MRVDHPAGELPDRPDRYVPQHPHRQAGQVWPGCRLDREAIQDGPGAVLRLPVNTWLAVANEEWQIMHSRLTHYLLQRRHLTLGGHRRMQCPPTKA